MKFRASDVVVPCDYCATPVRARRYRIARGRGIYCKRSCKSLAQVLQKSGTIPQRLTRGIDTSAGIDACHPWTKSRDLDGYGRIGFGGKCLKVVTVLWEAQYGPVPEGKELGHTCDYEPCCNLRHIAPVTHRRNMEEAAERQHTALGEANGCAKLNTERVLIIRTDWANGMTQSALGRREHVNPATIGDIAHRRTWRHI